MSDSPAAVIVDSAGVEVDVLDDAGVKRLAGDSKVTDSVLPTGAAAEVTLASLEAKDFATQTTLAAFLAAFSAEDFASETKLEAVRVLLASLDGKDYATQTTLATLLTEATFAAEDFASETTLATVLTEADFIARTGLVSATPGSNTVLGRLKDIFDSIVARLGTLGQKAMVASTPVVIASDQTPIDSRITDASGNGLGVDDGVLIPAGTDGLLAMGTDYDDIAHRLRTTSDGRLITNSAVAAPPGNTAVNENETGDVTGTDNSYYTIPNGEQLKIQRFAGGAEADSAGSKVELYWAPNGNTSGIEIIRTGYVDGNNFEFTLDWDAPLVGDGTRAILLRRQRLTGGSVEVVGFWDGYY